MRPSRRPTSRSSERQRSGRRPVSSIGFQRRGSPGIRDFVEDNVSLSTASAHSGESHHRFRWERDHRIRFRSPVSVALQHGDHSARLHRHPPECIDSVRNGLRSDTGGEKVERLKITLGAMVAVAFVASMDAAGHSGEVGADGCHADGEPYRERYHCHFRISNSTWIDLDPPGTPVHKIRKADRQPSRHRDKPKPPIYRDRPAGCSPNMLEGVAKVIDGDTIEIAGNRLRLHGIDAPEGRQRCRRKADGTSWAVGRAAARALRGMIAGGRVCCSVRRERDQYGRVVGTCYTNGADLNRRMVSQGYALAYRHYSRRYVRDEQSARAAGAGIHSCEYESPRDWRRRNSRRRNR